MKDSKARDDLEFSTWVPMLMRMTQVSLVGFAIGGAFLSFMLLDLSFYIPGIVVLVHATMHERRKGVHTALASASPQINQEIQGARKNAQLGRPTA